MMEKSSVKITFIYLIVGVLWILTSDWLVHQFFSDKQTNYFFFQELKGIAFVLVTASILFILLRKNENEIEEAQNQFEMTYLHNPIPMAIYNVDTMKIIDANKALLNQFEYTIEELQQTKVVDVVPKEELNNILFQNEIITGKPLTTGVFKVFSKSRKVLYVTLITTPAVFHGINARLMLILDAQELEESRKELESRNIQLKNIEHITSHNVRRHLANILALGTLIGEMTPEESEKEGIHKKIEFSALMLDNEIKNLIEQANKSK